FAAAREAVGAPEVGLELAPGATLGEALSTLPESAAAVLARCSLLVDGVAEDDRATLLREGTTVDVLPPFAGG
ncbi:MAG: MoaD/ThiS family protein, partial [Micrococcales bacterium]|nr:MoaD/ThiS family protein [Micrococcales bacterium]